MKYFASLVLVLALPFELHCQLENAQWRFFSNVGISFTTTPPATLIANGAGGGAASSISDASGTLLFYIGSDIRNKLGQIMAGFIGSFYSNYQNSIICKKPGNNSLYYMFYTSSTGLRYYVVDMSLAAGAGSVTVQNATLTTQQQSWMIAGTRHCNGKDIWIVTQEAGQTSWRAYLITANGILGPYISITSHQHIIYHALKFSADGTKIATAEHGDGIFLYDFDSATGAVSGMTVVSTGGFPAWGVEFSPDGKELYGSLGHILMQWDLAAGSASAITGSQYTVSTSPVSGIEALQLAVDGKIYKIHGTVNTELGVINNPNAVGSNCNYSVSGISFAPNYSNDGLPNMVKPRLPLPTISYSISQVTCQAALFTPVITTLTGIPSVLPPNILWNFGDPGSGSWNISPLNNPLHAFSAPGTYTVKLILTKPCGWVDTVYQSVTIPNNTPAFTLSGNNLTCMGQTTTLSANGAASYTWTSSFGYLSGNSIIVSPTVSTTYLVYASNGGCITQNTISVSILPPSIFGVTGSNSLCVGKSTVLTAIGVQNYTWTASSGVIGTGSSVVLTPTATTSYTVFGVSPSVTCISQLPVVVSVFPNPLLMMTGATTVCVAETAIFTASGSASYTWNYFGGG
jgi:hypothetical protein